MKQCSKCKEIKEFKDFYKQKSAKDGYNPWCKECRKKIDLSPNRQDYLKSHAEEYNKTEKRKESRKIHDRKRNQTLERKESKNRRKRLRRQEDNLYRISDNLRSRTRQALTSNGLSKKLSFSKYLGCSYEDLRRHLENQFQDGMNWTNYGLSHGKWNIDHIIPLKSASNEEELYKLCHFSNLQPLWAIDNIVKKDKMPEINTSQSLFKELGV